MNTTNRFIGELITVDWDNPPLLEKTPRCPDRFTWGELTLEVTELQREWKDTERRGRMGENMRPENLARARLKGSWGVGRFFYRVVVTDGRVFEIYYDRAPQGTKNRKGVWMIFQEILPLR